MYARSMKDPDGFGVNRQSARLDQTIHQIRTSWDPDNLFIKWFEDGTLNVTTNCIDRHLPKRAKQTAIIWEGDDPANSNTYLSAIAR